LSLLLHAVTIAETAMAIIVTFFIAIKFELLVTGCILIIVLCH
jgi:hypothetical protein